VSYTEEDARRDLGLPATRTPRYDDIPKDEADGVSVKLWKAVKCIDALATAAFERYIPDELQVDQRLDARLLKRDMTFGCAIPTDIPVPTNRKIARALGIPPNCRDESAFFPALAARMCQIAEQLGVNRLAPPLVFRCDGEPGVSRPLIGLILKFDRTPPDGMRSDELMATIGVL